MNRLAAFIIGSFLFFPPAFAADLVLTDPNYQALRNDTVSGSYRVSGLVLKRDAGTFTFQSGVFSLGRPVLGKQVFAVFIGDGTFHLTPAAPGEAAHLKVVTGTQEPEEVFHRAVFCFTDGTAGEIMAAARVADESSSAAAAAFQDFRNLVRGRSDEPLSHTQAIIGGEDVVNVDAELLRELYTPGRESFSAYIHGQKHGDLRFFVNPAGAVPQLPSPEETALVDPEPDADYEGILYLSHLKSEWENKTANSLENHRWVQAESYRIETAIGGNDHLAATAAIKMKVLTDGARVVKFGLLPALRVASVKIGDQNIPFIQEARTADGSFYLIFPAPMKAGSEVEVSIAYSGDKVVRKEGGGTFAVRARTSWYPSLNAFTDRATYDLTFRVPKRYTLVSVGMLEKSSTEKDDAVTHWVSEAPLAVAGFNYGEFKELAKKDDVTGKEIEIYTTRDLPDYLTNAKIMLAPNSMAQNTFVDTLNSLRIYEIWFGKLPYGRVAVTEQPEFNFGQSWPSLVFLPISAFFDSGQQHALLGGKSVGLTNFTDEVTPHEVSHQWWGHEVGWATYRDQWLSEGFANFSASVFLQFTTKGDEVRQYWERQRRRILDKNEYGASANDAGPLSMGMRLAWRKNESAYDFLTYSKGAYILQMLKSMMWDGQTQDKAFMDMMHEFALSGRTSNASTETFAALAAKYMKPGMDLGGDKTMNWFFNEWVYGTDIPHYTFEYSLAQEANGAVALTGHLTQSGVRDDFRMKVPLYIENADKLLARVGMVPVGGNSTNTFKIQLPAKPLRVMVNAQHDVLATDTVNRQIP